MVSKRKYFSMSLIMFVLFFMFQLFQVIKETENKYDVNDFAKEPAVVSEDAWKMTKISYSEKEAEGKKEETLQKEWSKEELSNLAVLISYGSESRENIISDWCCYTKRSLEIFSSLEEFLKKKIQPEVLLIDAGRMDYERDLTELMKRVKKGQNVVFLTLPTASVIRSNKNLRSLLGIEKVMKNEITLSGIKLFEGFLLGGETLYQAEKEEDKKNQDFDLHTAWYLTDRNVKTYMAGMLEEKYLPKEERRNEKLPALIWRASYEKGKVFAVNGDYMEDNAAIGILDAMMAEAKEVEIYPVVNAQNISVVNYPGFADENEDEMLKTYHRSLTGFFRDVIWPGMLATQEQTKSKMTCFFAPQMNYLDKEEPQKEPYIFYLKQLKEQGMEAGISLESVYGNSIEEKLLRDEEFFESAGSSYHYAAAYLPERNRKDFSAIFGNTKNKLSERFTTVVSEGEKNETLLCYFTEGVTHQKMTSEGTSHTFREDFYMKSIQTALGYSNLLLDMKRVSWPKDSRDHWEKMYEQFASNLDTYWHPFQNFDQTTLSESDERVRSFLSLDYRKMFDGKEITLSVLKKPYENAWFLLRTHGREVAGIKGGSYQKIEEDAYLIRAENDAVKVRLMEYTDHKYDLADLTEAEEKENEDGNG